MNTTLPALKLLSDETHVFPQTPPYDQAMAARFALEQAEAGVGSAAELEEHVLLLAEYVQMLRDSVDVLGPVLRNAAFLAGVGAIDVSRALALMSAGLRFESVGAPALRQAMQRLAAQLAPPDQPLPPAPGFHATGELEPDAEQRMAAAYAAGRAFDAGCDWAARGTAAWQQLLERLAGQERGSAAGPAGLDEILCAAKAAGPSVHLPLQPESASLRVWTKVLMNALRNEVPFGIVPHALLRLGFGRTSLPGMDALVSTAQSLARATAQEALAMRLLLVESPAMKREAAPAGSCIVACRPLASATEAWTERPARAMFLVLPAQESGELLAQDSPILRLLPAPLTLAWERDDDKDAREFEKILREEAGRRQARFTDLDASRFPALATSRGPDELIALGRSA